MEKYQAALDGLKDTKCDDCKLCSITNYCGHYKCIKTLQEAVDKANKYDEKETPKKFKKILDYSVVCPSCGHHLDKILGRNYDYCPRCGQRLDWSDEVCQQK